MGTPGHPDPRTAQLTACSEEMHVSLGKLLNGQFPRHSVGFSNRELPEGPRAPSGTAVSHPEWLCPQAPRPHTLVTSLLSASHTSVFKSPWLPQQRGVKGGRPAQRARCQGRPDLHWAGAGARGLGQARNPPRAQVSACTDVVSIALDTRARSVHRSRRPLPRTQPSLPARLWTQARLLPALGKADKGLRTDLRPRARRPRRSGIRVGTRAAGRGARGLPSQD